jgi:hypothetical protein
VLCCAPTLFDAEWSMMMMRAYGQYDRRGMCWPHKYSCDDLRRSSGTTSRSAERAIKRRARTRGKAEAAEVMETGGDCPRCDWITARAACPMCGALCPFGAVGDRLWVHVDGGERDPWLSPVRMPRWASRLTLEITEVRLQRLQEISEADARAEGVRELPLQEGQQGAWWTADALAGSEMHATDPVSAYRKSWDSGKRSRPLWANNPWVWAIAFSRVP